MFLCSYARPVKFWERKYKTYRLDSRHERMADLVSGSDVNNLNSVFYEHLMRKLQLSLSRDIHAGRYGNVRTGDFLLLLNDKLTALVHIVELGNGHCSFQLRGMEFQGKIRFSVRAMARSR